MFDRLGATDKQLDFRSFTRRHQGYAGMNDKPAADAAVQTIIDKVAPQVDPDGVQLQVRLDYNSCGADRIGRISRGKVKPTCR
jgi:predicted membrane GTPase involved in stress response